MKGNINAILYYSILANLVILQKQIWKAWIKAKEKSWEI